MSEVTFKVTAAPAEDVLLATAFAEGKQVEFIFAELGNCPVIITTLFRKKVGFWVVNGRLALRRETANGYIQDFRLWLDVNKGSGQVRFEFCCPHCGAPLDRDGICVQYCGSLEENEVEDICWTCGQIADRCVCFAPELF